jgi:hypothetical protein
MNKEQNREQATVIKLTQSQQTSDPVLQWEKIFWTTAATTRFKTGSFAHHVSKTLSNLYNQVGDPPELFEKYPVISTFLDGILDNFAARLASPN